MIWSNTSTATVSDSRGNTYVSAAGRTTWGSNWSAQVFYAKSIAGGANTVTATFGSSINSFAVMYIHEYSGVDKLSPVDGAKTAIGTGSAMNSGPLTTTNASDLLFSAGASSAAVTAGGSGYTTRSTVAANITQDRVVSSAGSYNAGATQNGNAWVMQLVAFKADSGSAGDTTPPTVSITAPANNAQVNDIVNVMADASDDVGVASVQFLVDGTPTGVEDTTAPYALAWDTRSVPNGAHTLTARATDTAGNTKLSSAVNVNVSNTSSFQNEILATGFNLPTAIKFLPDGRMLVVGAAGHDQGAAAAVHDARPDAVPAADQRRLGRGAAGHLRHRAGPELRHQPLLLHLLHAGVSEPRPALALHRQRARSPARSPAASWCSTRIRRTPTPSTTAARSTSATTASCTSRPASTSTPPQLKTCTTRAARSTASIRTARVPTDDPFYDGNGPNWDSIWALGLRNPYRAYYDSPSGKLFIGDVGGNVNATSIEEVDVGARGANYGWPDYEGACPSPCTSPIYSYPHNGPGRRRHRRVRLPRRPVPQQLQGQLLLRRLHAELDQAPDVRRQRQRERRLQLRAARRLRRRPYGDIVYLDRRARRRAVLRRPRLLGHQRHLRRQQDPPDPLHLGQPAADCRRRRPTRPPGPSPLTVNFSSAGSSDPEGQPLTYEWTFGDGADIDRREPRRTPTRRPASTRRGSRSPTASTPRCPRRSSIIVGSPPTATILSPQDGSTFRAGDVISFSGDATDADDGTLPASAFTWNIDFLHEGHVHPGVPQTGVKSGTFAIPTSGHDFSGNTRYRITLTVTDSDGPDRHEVRDRSSRRRSTSASTPRRPA